ncbi:hypothetical protein NPX13_g1602 [Xylaria arbuscula]|uniref:Uncharacterized protein n=1 Tax=Xylaria arbuscula TaxID=114810 RepID=A0A9W8TPZ1_9PEZI|nr:hypothetical protein NPX13_g1602 [Xylaria arbuscula]
MDKASQTIAFFLEEKFPGIQSLTIGLEVGKDADETGGVVEAEGPTFAALTQGGKLRLSKKTSPTTSVNSAGVRDTHRLPGARGSHPARNHRQVDGSEWADSGGGRPTEPEGVGVSDGWKKRLVLGLSSASGWWVGSSCPRSSAITGDVEWETGEHDVADVGASSCGTYNTPRKTASRSDLMYTMPVRWVKETDAYVSNVYARAWGLYRAPISNTLMSCSSGPL